MHYIMLATIVISGGLFVYDSVISCLAHNCEEECNNSAIRGAKDMDEIYASSSLRLSTDSQILEKMMKFV